MASSPIPAADLKSFTDHLRGCKRVIALLGAGISASSGLPTFRGAGGIWRSYDATALATPEAFNANPDLVWQFYSYRRHMALKAQPNRAHYALAKLAKKNSKFITLTQNVDGLSQRAGHPSHQLHLLHGSLFTVKCTSFYCSYSRENDFTDPIVPALALPKGAANLDPSPEDSTGEQASRALAGALKGGEGEETELDISDERVPLPALSPDVLPRCPECKEGLLRPGVVWFGESLPLRTLDYIDKWLSADTVDLILVIGTSSQVYPAAGYVDKARARGARVAVINMDRNDVGSSGLTSRDWFFQGDAGVIVPQILEPIIGKV
ncbi:SIR2 family NAD-dependent protein deacylase [Aspergillus brunneoviolaceus CBS 621.78]|uniref:NAD-dependent protein deacylase n=2 Tax=Aspergillus TaxID=5052 RepID=A0A8G1W1Q9_9EURO|nr:putative SIR2 family histone deacetylase [Aspergillus brunneoviolaceus CBS 621.78]XP_040801294.1 putative SIR2 family histone deacetylase [Aspergillus fijiensis CBS 313.89]RAH40844.1 putative SIR2 family histone deacetylase [Aspergillus brunneoviolaceus CBS 621.78]RAK77284.1 putative SIR2 family histone deacetylase [Aspergillus fijiensis CBS 313.89]